MPDLEDVESRVSAQGAPRHLICRDCHKSTVRKSNAQKICADCKKEQSRLITVAWVKRKAIARGGGTTRGHVFQCAQCDKDVVRGSGAQKLCSGCRAEAKKAYLRAYQRRRRGVTVPLGETIICATCPAEIIKRGGLQKYCAECRQETQRTIDRELYRRSQGRKTANFGDIINCERCSREIVRKGALQKFCDECRPIELKEKGTKNQARRMASSPRLRLNSRVGSAIARSLRGTKAGAHWEDLVGYSLDELLRHLEKQFLFGMTFDNYGEWHVDHILPLAMWSFDNWTHPNFKCAWALTNLRPLWASDNQTKHARRLHLL